MQLLDDWNIELQSIIDLYNDKSVFYFKEKEEIDFVIPRLKIAIEVKYFSDRNYFKKGLDNLMKISPENYQKILISKDINDIDLETGIKIIDLKTFFETLFDNN